MDKVIIKAPASTANLGSGFDTMGIALSLYNTVVLEQSDNIDISFTDGLVAAKDARNLVYKTVENVYNQCGITLKGLKITQTSPIPQARGLGSSSACIAAGIVGANKLLNDKLSKQDMLNLACEIEGHPDNVVPCMLGGFVTSVYENNNLYYAKKDVSSELGFCSFVPKSKLLTSAARGVLPKSVPYEDAVYNVSRAALLSAAFCEGRTELFKIATGDRLHHQYRLGLIAGGTQLFDGLSEISPLAYFISGAGSTIMAITQEKEQFAKNAALLLASKTELSDFEMIMLKVDNQSMI